MEKPEFLVKGYPHMAMGKRFLIALSISSLFFYNCSLLGGDDEAYVDPVPLAAVTGLAPDGAAYADAAVELSWTALTGASRYDIQIASTEAGLESATAVSVSATAYTPSEAPDDFWYWRVRGVDSDGTAGAWSAIAALTVNWAAAQPAGLSPDSSSVTTDTTPTLTWTAVPGAASYEVQIATSSVGVSLAAAETVSSAVYTPSSCLDNQSAHYWRVRAMDSGGVGTEWTDISSFTVNWGTTGPADGIRFPKELAYIATYVATYGAGTYSLAADLDLSGTSDWTPIGSSTVPFTGTFDGNGHTISGLTISSTSTYRGLFGYIGDGGSVSDLVLDSVSINSTGTYVGGLAGYSLGPVTACSVSGSVTGAQYTGGLIGYTASATMQKCSSSATVSGTSSVGGIVGYGSAGSIEQCYTTGSVSGSGNLIGGLVGHSNSCGIINSYATGAIIGGRQCGGLAGYKTPASQLINSYAYGSVSGSDNLGGIVGASSSTAYITGCFFDSDTVGTAASASVYGTGKTTAQMQTKLTFTDGGWDFPGETANGTDDIWDITAGYNGGYPYLLNNLPK